MRDHPPATPLDRTLRRAAEGDAAAWRELVEAYTRRVFGLMLARCGDRDLAEELTQATFVKVVTKLDVRDGSVDSGGYAGRYEERGRFEAWLFRIAMNELRDEMRRRKRHAVPTDMSAGGGEHEPWGAAHALAAGPGGAVEDPAEVVSRAEQVDRLRIAIAQLSDADQEVLRLRHTAGLSFAQIAEVLGQPLGTVLARAHRALGKLRKLMSEEEPEAARLGERTIEAEEVSDAAERATDE